MDLNDITIANGEASTNVGAQKLLPPAPPEALPGWRGRVIYLYDPKTGTSIRKVFGADSHLGAIED